MTTIAESVGAKGQTAAGLAEGVKTISLNQTITFTLYERVVLPLDGYVFWVNASLRSDSAIFNATQYNLLEYNNYQLEVPDRQFVVQGSLHYSTDLQQKEDNYSSQNHILFTSLEPVKNFNLVGPNLMYIASYEGMKFSFNRRDNFYKQADLYHYRGDALYNMFYTQVIDSITGFDTENVIVSNSLPIWLTLNQFFPLFPSFLVEQNASPLYASVDITNTEALQAFPYIETNSSHWQLVKDTVKITIYGTRNYNALEFQDYVFKYSVETDNIGMMNTPVIKDEKLTQPEFGILAMKKSITFDVSYYQQNIRSVAVKTIEQAAVTVTTSF